MPCWRVRDHSDPEIWGDSAAESPESGGWAQRELALPRAACGRVTRQSQAQPSPFWHPPPANMGEMSLPPRLPGFCRCLCRCLSPPGPGQDRDVWKGNHRPQARLCPPNPCGHRAAAPAPTAPARSHGGFYTSTPKFWLLLPLKNGGIFVQTRSPPCGKHGQNPSPSFDISGCSSKYLSTDFAPFPSFQGGSRVSETVIRSRNTWEQLPPLLSAYTSSSTHTFESPVAFQLGILLKESLSDILREVSGCPVTWSISFVSAGLLPGSPGAQGPPPFTKNLETTTSPGSSPPILVFGFSPARLCLPRPGEPRGNSRGAAPELHRASCPSLRRGPRLCCHPVRRGRQRGQGSADTSP